MINSKLEEALKQLDLKGVVMLQGVLVNRALELLYEAEKPKSSILVPVL